MVATPNAFLYALANAFNVAGIVFAGLYSKVHVRVDCYKYTNAHKAAPANFFENVFECFVQCFLGLDRDANFYN